MTAPVSQVLSEAAGGQYGEFQLVSGNRPEGLSDDEGIMTHEVTRGWGSRPFIRKVSEIDWKPVFGIRRAAALAKEQGR